MAKATNRGAEAGDGYTEIPVIDPASIGVADPAADTGDTASAGSGSGTTTKRRRRNSGSAAGAKTKKANPDAVGLEKILFSIHAMAAHALKEPVFALDEQESKLLAKAISDVNEHYNFGVDPKVMAWVSLAGVAASIYAPRVVAIKAKSSKLKKEKEKEKETTQSPSPTSTPTLTFGEGAR